MPSICAARQIKPQRDTVEGRGGRLRHISARNPRSFIPRVDEKFVGRQALTFATLEVLSGKCQIGSQGVRHTLR
jgi:hypothetical protein